MQPSLIQKMVQKTGCYFILFIFLWWFFSTAGNKEECRTNTSLPGACTKGTNTDQEVIVVPH